MKTICDVIENARTKWSDKPFVFSRGSDGFEAKSFGQLCEDSLALAAALDKLGISGGVGLFAANSYGWMVCDLAISGYIGMSVCFDRGLCADELLRLAQLTEIKYLFYSAETADRAEILAEKLGVKILSIERELPLLTTAGALLPVPKPRHADDAAKIVFTSGSCALPKAVMLSQKNLLSGWEGLYRRAPMGCEDSCYLFLPLSHTYGGIFNFLYPLIFGMKIYLCSDISLIAQELPMARPTIISAVPLMLERFVRAASDDNPQILKAALGGCVKYLFCGGAPLSDELRGVFATAGINLLNAYALSETSSVLSIEYSDSIERFGVGAVFENIEVKIAADGEILVRGDNVFMGYFNNPAATAEAFDEDGFFRTGDTGYLSESTLCLTGRKKRIIVFKNGMKLSPADVEEKLCACADISAAKVYSEDEDICAVIFAASQLAADNAVIRVNEVLPHYGRISRYEVKTDNLTSRIK